MARRLAGRVGWIKVGLEAFVAEGPSLVGEVASASRARVFLDLKFHDIPATVAGAVASAARSGAAIVNLHASGGRAMLEAAREAADPRRARTLIAVTLLTSLDVRALADLPIAGHPEGIARRLRSSRRRAGWTASCARRRTSPRSAMLAEASFSWSCPASGPPAPTRDQKRVATPGAALAAGADLLVIGRPVTSAPDPEAALDRILEEMAAVHRT